MPLSGRRRLYWHLREVGIEGKDMTAEREAFQVSQMGIRQKPCSLGIVRTCHNWPRDYYDLTLCRMLLWDIIKEKYTHSGYQESLDDIMACFMCNFSDYKNNKINPTTSAFLLSSGWGKIQKFDPWNIIYSFRETQSWNKAGNLDFDLKLLKRILLITPMGTRRFLQWDHLPLEELYRWLLKIKGTYPKMSPTGGSWGVWLVGLSCSPKASELESGRGGVPRSSSWCPWQKAEGPISILRSLDGTQPKSFSPKSVLKSSP